MSRLIHAHRASRRWPVRFDSQTKKKSCAMGVLEELRQATPTTVTDMTVTGSLAYKAGMYLWVKGRNATEYEWGMRNM